MLDILFGVLWQRFHPELLFRWMILTREVHSGLICNVARNSQLSRFPTDFIRGVVGPRQAACQLRYCLPKRESVLRGLLPDATRAYIVKHIVAHPAPCGFCWTGKPGRTPIDQQMTLRLLACTGNTITTTAAVIIVDYGMCWVTQDLLEESGSFVRRHGVC